MTRRLNVALGMVISGQRNDENSSLGMLPIFAGSHDGTRSAKGSSKGFEPDTDNLEQNYRSITIITLLPLQSIQRR